MQTETTAGEILAKQKMIQRKILWYKDHHRPYDDISAAEMSALWSKAAGGEWIGALYDCYRFAFARGYKAAQRDAKKKGVIV